jgi:acyl dehydratase
MLMVHRVRAVNQSLNSENKIHDDKVARSLGFGAGLVPGVTVFAYMTHPVVATYGLSWFRRGTMSVRFDRPIHDGDEVEVKVEEDGGLVVTATTANGACASGTAGLHRKAPIPPGLEQYHLAELPAQRPPADGTGLAPGRVLGTIRLPVDSAVEATYRDEVMETLSIYSQERLLHPGRLLHGCNLALSQNVLMGPWIHTGSELAMYSPAREGETVELRARVKDRFERKGHHFVVLDILATAEGRPVMHCLHTAIYRLRLPR